MIKKISKFYPGRASSSQTIDICITLLSIGSIKYKTMLKERKEMFVYLKEKMIEVAAKYDEKIFDTPNNPISMGKRLL